MKKFIITTCIIVLAAGIGGAVETPMFPTPQKEHEWFKQLVGEWESEMEMFMEPGKPPVKAKGSESARMLGGFWLVAEGKADFMGTAMTSIFTLGYDAEKKKYVATWVDSMTSHLWKYDGTVDAAGKVLTFQAQGPCPLKPGKLSNFKEVIEIKSNDHKISTAYIQEDDGKWTTMAIVNSRKKK